RLPEVESKPVAEVTLFDPACGAGHFLLEAFDLFYRMYEEEGTLHDPEAICAAIFRNNLFGFDIDERAVGVARVVLRMRAVERAPGFRGVPPHVLTSGDTSSGQVHHTDELGALLRTERPDVGLPAPMHDVLGRRYDVVATNPPYIGRKYMGARLKDYLACHYPDTRRD